MGKNILTLFTHGELAQLAKRLLPRTMVIDSTGSGRNFPSYTAPVHTSNPPATPEEEAMAKSTELPIDEEDPHELATAGSERLPFGATV